MMSHTLATEQEKVAYLEEHISYDLVMLNFTFMRLMTSQPSTPEEQLDFNAHFSESFAVHARNLLSLFLTWLVRMIAPHLTTCLTSRRRTKRP